MFPFQLPSLDVTPGGGHHHQMSLQSRVSLLDVSGEYSTGGGYSKGGWVIITGVVLNVTGIV